METWEFISVYVCVCELERRHVKWTKWEKKCNKNPLVVTLSKSLEGSVTSSDSWIHSVAMSTRENVVLEGHTEELTSTTCVWNAQNIQVFHHSHESFSTCAAGHQALTSAVTPEGSLTTVSFDIWCQNGRLAISPRRPSPPTHTFTMWF